MTARSRTKRQLKSVCCAAHTDRSLASHLSDSTRGDPWKASASELTLTETCLKRRSPSFRSFVAVKSTIGDITTLDMIGQRHELKEQVMFDH